MTDFDRQEAFEKLRAHNLSFLNEISEGLGGENNGLNNHAVRFSPLMEAGDIWTDHSWDGSLNEHPAVYNIDTTKQMLDAYLEKGTPFMGNSLVADVVTEIQMMLPEVRVTVVPKLKLEYVHVPDNPYDVFHMLKWDEKLRINCHYQKFHIDRSKQEIIIATSYNLDDVMRSAYQAVWDMIGNSIWPQGVYGAELERIEKVGGAEFSSLAINLPLEDYENELRNAMPGHNGNFSPVVQNMVYTAGIGFVSYLMNLRLLHAVPYILRDEDSDEFVFPRFADLYHRILNGEGGDMIRAHKRFLSQRSREIVVGSRQAA